MYSTDGTFHERLGKMIHDFVHKIYDASSTFPREELFGVTSQIRRAALSVALNYTEGYARFSKKELNRFLRISYGSLKEVLYLWEFARERGWLNDDGKETRDLGNGIGGMLWSIFYRD